MDDIRPNLDPFSDLISGSRTRRYVLFEHRHPLRGRHFDLMVESSRNCWLLDFEGFPSPGSYAETVSWRYYGTMRQAYLNLGSRHNASLGLIRRVESGAAIIKSSDSEHIRLRLASSHLFPLFRFVKTPEGILIQQE